MTTKSLDEMIAVMQAARDGKRIECLYLRRSDSEWIHVQAHPLWNWEMFDYRVKPEPKLRPWKPEEVPMPCVVRSKMGKHVRWLILAVSSAGAVTANSQEAESTDVCSFSDLMECNEHSLDGGKTWKPCGVEE